MQFTTIRLWKQAPFLRLLIPFIAGILLQYHFPCSFKILLVATITSFVGLLLFLLLNLKQKYKYYLTAGICINILLACFGAIIVYCNDANNDNLSIQNNYSSQAVVFTLQEPLVKKSNSFKANASVDFLIANNDWKPVSGNIIVYFSKDSATPKVAYGSQIIIKKTLQAIKNSGNPGAFDYKKYCAFQHIYYQVYLKPGDYIVMKEKKINAAKQFLFNTTTAITGILQKYIPGKKEQGLAEALLIGYKNDLDKELVQAYSNTGVVHIIAISGLHLGVIFWMLSLLLKPLGNNKASKILRPAIIIVLLWLFSILSGAAPSIMRSAVMFTCVLLGNSFSRRISVFNTLAASAFLLLCYNPYWLWDVGFQLSYGAVLSIVIFMRPIYNCMHVKNKLLNNVWEAASVTIAAQILTTPISIYYFHQFPVFFLITNILAVPISSLVLIGEIVLCAMSFINPVAVFVGKLLAWLIWFMNSIIEHIDSISFSTWQNLQINMPQNLLLYVVILAFSLYVFQKKKQYVFIGLFGLCIFVSMRTFAFYKAARQQKVIVYNVPQMQAIDIIDGRTYKFMGDEELLEDGFLQNFHLKPSRVMQRMTFDTVINNTVVNTGNKRIFIIDETKKFVTPTQKIKTDVIVISHNPKLYITEITDVFDCGVIVFDGSNPDWKIEKWKNDCERLGQKYFSVKDKGAYVIEGD